MAEIIQLVPREKSRAPFDGALPPDPVDVLLEQVVMDLQRELGRMHGYQVIAVGRILDALVRDVTGLVDQEWAKRLAAGDPPVPA